MRASHSISAMKGFRRCHSFESDNSYTTTDSLRDYYPYDIEHLKASHGAFKSDCIHLSLRCSGNSSTSRARRALFLSVDGATDTRIASETIVSHEHSSARQSHVSTGRQSSGPDSVLDISQRSYEANRGKRYCRRASRNAALLDRFIPSRGCADTYSMPFRVNKSPHQLTGDEKLLRQRSPMRNPFMPVRTRRPPRVREKRKPSQHFLIPHHYAHLVESFPVDQLPLPNAGEAPVQFDARATWNTRGAPTALGRTPIRVADGSGGYLAGGTTAPMHSARFLETITSADELDQHELRVALALDIDLTTRRLDTCRPSPVCKSTSNPASLDYMTPFSFAFVANGRKKTQGSMCKSTINNF